MHILNCSQLKHINFRLSEDVYSVKNIDILLKFPQMTVAINVKNKICHMSVTDFK